MRAIIRLRSLPAALLLSLAFHSLVFGQTCDHIRLRLKNEDRVRLDTFVRWDPQKCLTVAQGYQNGNLRDERGVDILPSGERVDRGVPSGSLKVGDLTRGQKGRTEIKLWYPNRGSFEHVWVIVE